LQASRGMTRPDFVVHDDNGTEVGWFDITSEGSLGHIDKKTGSGWTNKPYVAEITYKPLDVSDLGTGNISIGQKVVLRNAYKRRVKAWEQLVANKKKHFESVWGVYKGPEENSQQGKRDTAKFALGGPFPGLHITDTVAASLLRSFDLPVKQFGFQKGGTRSEGDLIIQTYENE
jgi:hypothetical protein